ncbi:MAG: HAMP domain-containing histidine kinase [Arcobacteraceae bacterium]|nr:HAMP domain-containing histidine kinase [Arcobacteraceae bacterium]
MSQPSIYREFSKKLILATSLFTILISFMFYGFTKATVYEEITDNLLTKAKLIRKVSIDSLSTNDQLKLIIEKKLDVDLIQDKTISKITFREFYKNNNHYIELLYPFDLKEHSFIQIVKNINSTDEMLRRIFSNVFILGLGGLVMIIIYALAMSKTLLFPIINITNKLSNMNENSLTQIDIQKLPIEFTPLANSINSLTKKIETYVKYQKELFIGAAHELKTPLAVIKLKSEVILLKNRPIEKYEETLKLFIKEVDGMDKMVGSILNIGRQEGAQFEKPIELDIVSFIDDKLNNYKLLANEKKIEMIFNCSIEKFITIIQPTLLNQILQNFIQNAIKFTPNEKTISISIHQIDDSISIEVSDEGVGVDENVDLFAPFKRIGNAQGAGLGLFLAKSATDAIGAQISIKNRTDNIQGTVATLKLQTNPTCSIKTT